ncbi:MAG: hypothetical protein RSE41_05230 [Clostridia bacterium]
MKDYYLKSDGRKLLSEDIELIMESLKEKNKHSTQIKLLSSLVTTDKNYFDKVSDEIEK